ncbi:polymorphic toxin-type HINT domain-containing protein [Kitasatospora sp. NPDC091207]|uniref:polymorphic toxin-type HINT domain-containing protein n=1 Tax=Kitasatospora sp. NPDC091207 TaxID=3364083 RepID=UPI0038143C61
MTATAGHPMLVEDAGWVPVEAIDAGDRLLSPDGSLVVVQSVVDYGIQDDSLVYNLTVGDLHTFTVLDGDNDLLTHNDGLYCPHGRAPTTKFTRGGKKKVWTAAKEKGGGTARCEDCRVVVVKPKQSKRGVTPPNNEGHVDHVWPKSKGGNGCPCNGELRCRSCNIGKSNH